MNTHVNDCGAQRHRTREHSYEVYEAPCEVRRDRFIECIVQ